MKVKFWITAPGVEKDATLDISGWDTMDSQERDAQMLNALSEMGFEWGMVSEHLLWEPQVDDPRLPDKSPF